MPYNVGQILEDSARKHGDNPAVITDVLSTSFAQLHLNAENIRNEFRQKQLKDGAGVGLQVENSATFISALFGLVRAGVVVVPLSTELHPREFEDISREIGLSAVLYQKGSKLAGEFDKLQGDDICDLRLAYIDRSAGAVAPHISNPAFIRPTSGTTGRSKGVVLSHETVADRITAAQEALKLSAHDRVAWVMPMAYHFVVSVILYINSGSPIVIVPSNFGSSILDFTLQHGCTVLYATPSHYALLTATEREIASPPFRLALSTAAPLSTRIAEQFAERFGQPIRQLYGMIEIGLPLGNLKDRLAAADSLGWPLPGFKALIIGEDGNPLEPGQIGELFLSGPGIFDGYQHPPILKEQLLINGFLATGDLAYQHDDHSITVVGRKKNLIITGGNKVFPEQVEEIINSHPSVSLCRVYGMPHELLGEMVVADIVLKAESACAVSEITKYCRSHLASHNIPLMVNFKDHIGTTGSGKIKRWG